MNNKKLIINCWRVSDKHFLVVLFLYQPYTCSSVFCTLVGLSIFSLNLGQNIQEWTKQNLWKTAFKIFEVIWSAKGSLLQRLSSKNVSSSERVKPWFFVTFNIILKRIFPESFIEFPRVVQKI